MTTNIKTKKGKKEVIVDHPLIVDIMSVLLTEVGLHRKEYVEEKVRERLKNQSQEDLEKSLEYLKYSIKHPFRLYGDNISSWRFETEPGRTAAAAYKEIYLKYQLKDVFS